MAEKRALVVDDSRSARAFLGRILERHDLVVDSVESAEEAIDYLARQHPDVIFMDHLMPGMDGLQAVRQIKSDPRTATIPILMYTSQEGELYLSQARALGAVGVLPKQTRPGDVTKTLIQLRLVADRREAEATTRTGEQPRLAAPTAVPAATVPDAGVESLTPELRRLVSALLNDHSSEMRRFVVEHLESHADRIVGDVRHMLRDESAAQAEPIAPPPLPPPRRSYWLPVLGTLAALLAASSLWFWQQLVSSQRETNEQLARARKELAELQSRLQQNSRLTGLETGTGTAPTRRELRDSTVELVPFGESPLSGVRVEHIQTRLEQLLVEGFRGRVLIHSYAGRFCLGSDATALADDELPYAQCVLATAVPGTNGATRESVAFANMIAALRKRAGDALEITQLAGNPEQLAAPYPAVAGKLTAAEWNAAAALNNRVEVHWVAAP